MQKAISTLAIVFITTISIGFTAVAGEPKPTITFLGRFKIENKSEGLDEPSGLALSRGSQALWTVSDNTKKIFNLSLDGKLKKNDSFEVETEGLEGVALNAAGRFLYTVQESKNVIIKIDLENKREVLFRPLAQMRGYETVADDFRGSENNKGLEGITIRHDDGAVFVIKEGKPGLLIEVSADLDRIRFAVRLDREHGFIDDDTADDKVDFSGICYDSKRKLLWIVSDKAKRLFLFDPVTKRVLQSFALGYSQDGDYREIKKAEGVAIDETSGRLYIVSDEEARLYVFQVK